VLVTVAAGSGVINHYVGGGPISRTAAVIAPGAVVMAMIYALDLGDGAQAVETAKKGLESAGAGSCLQFAWGKGLAVWGVGMLDTPEPDRGLKLLEDAKVKFAALEDDPEYGQKARAEMTDIDQRIHGEQKRKAKEKR
jgi:hypothetical protein